MPDILGVVSKPVFDTTVFRVGAAIRVDESSNSYSRNPQVFDAIVTAVSDLEIQFSSFNHRDGEMTSGRIPIEVVRSGRTKIRFLCESTKVSEQEELT